MCFYVLGSEENSGKLKLRLSIMANRQRGCLLKSISDLITEITSDISQAQDSYSVSGKKIIKYQDNKKQKNLDTLSKTLNVDYQKNCTSVALFENRLFLCTNEEISAGQLNDGFENLFTSVNSERIIKIYINRLKRNYEDKSEEKSVFGYISWHKIKQVECAVSIYSSSLTLMCTPGFTCVVVHPGTWVPTDVSNGFEIL